MCKIFSSILCFTYNSLARVLFPENNHGINNASKHADVDSNKVHVGKHVVTPKNHAHVGDKNVLQAAHNSRGEGGVVGIAEDHRVHQNKAHHTGKEKLKHKAQVFPPFKFNSSFYLATVESNEKSGNYHEEAVVECYAVLS